MSFSWTDCTCTRLGCSSTFYAACVVALRKSFSRMRKKSVEIGKRHSSYFGRSIPENCTLQQQTSLPIHFSSRLATAIDKNMAWCQVSRFVGRELNVAAMIAVHVLYQLCAIPGCPDEFRHLLAMLVPTVHVVKIFSSHWFTEQSISELEDWVTASVAAFKLHTPNVHRRPKVHMSTHTPDSVRIGGSAASYDGVVCLFLLFRSSLL